MTSPSKRDNAHFGQEAGVIGKADTTKGLQMKNTAKNRWELYRQRKHAELHGPRKYTGPSHIEIPVRAVWVKHTFDLQFLVPCPICGKAGHFHSQTTVTLGEVTNRSAHCDSDLFETPPAGYDLKIVEVPR